MSRLYVIAELSFIDASASGWSEFDILGGALWLRAATSANMYSRKLFLTQSSICSVRLNTSVSAALQCPLAEHDLCVADVADVASVGAQRQVKPF